LTTSTLGTNPLYWQILALVLRVLISIASYWTLNLILPRQKFTTLTASLLLLVFPGYSQHFVALTHINQELLALFFYIVSFGFTAQALHTKKTVYVIYAIVFQVLGIFPTEYFFTTEALRFCFILIALNTTASSSISTSNGESNSQGKQNTKLLSSLWLHAKAALRIWLPYLVVWAANGAWLFYYYRFGPYNSYSITVDDSQPGSRLSLVAFIDALYKVGGVIWVQIITLLSENFFAPSNLITLSLVIIVFITCVIYLLRSKISNESNHALFLIGTGTVGILLGRIPSWAAGLPLVLQSINDRFMVSMMVGGVLFITGVLELIRHEKARIILSALLIAFEVGQQFYNANIFRRDWEKQREFYWQMTWRIPALEKGTLILAQELPLEFETDFSATAAVNWIYAPDYKAYDELPFALMYTRSRLGGGKLPSLEPDTPATFPFRTVTFNGNTSKSITVFMPDNGCLRVLDPVYNNGNVYERYPRSLRNSIPLSDTTLIKAGPQAQPDEVVFGEEPEHNWCFYYEKAELARQFEDWAEVVRLGDQAFSKLEPSGLIDGYELLPFIEGYALTGDFAKASKLSKLALHAEIKPGTGVCQVWERVQAQGPEGSEAKLVAEEMLNELSCVH
jgi:hypothetical protein